MQDGGAAEKACSTSINCYLLIVVCSPCWFFRESLELCFCSWLKQIEAFTIHLVDSSPLCIGLGNAEVEECDFGLALRAPTESPHLSRPPVPCFPFYGGTSRAHAVPEKWAFGGGRDVWGVGCWGVFGGAIWKVGMGLAKPFSA